MAYPLYDQKNRAYLKNKGIRYAEKALGRPKKQTEQNREQLKQKNNSAKPIIDNILRLKVSLTKESVLMDSTTFKLKQPAPLKRG